jgi:hypothetical protein
VLVSFDSLDCYLLRFTTPGVHFVPTTTLPTLHQLVPLATSTTAYPAVIPRHQVLGGRTVLGRSPECAWRTERKAPPVSRLRHSRPPVIGGYSCDASVYKRCLHSAIVARYLTLFINFSQVTRAGEAEVACRCATTSGRGLRPLHQLHHRGHRFSFLHAFIHPLLHKGVTFIG